MKNTRTRRLGKKLIHIQKNLYCLLATFVLSGNAMALDSTNVTTSPLDHSCAKSLLLVATPVMSYPDPIQIDNRDYRKFQATFAPSRFASFCNLPTYKVTASCDVVASSSCGGKSCGSYIYLGYCDSSGQCPLINSSSGTFIGYPSATYGGMTQAGINNWSGAAQLNTQPISWGPNKPTNSFYVEVDLEDGNHTARALVCRLSLYPP